MEYILSAPSFEEQLKRQRKLEDEFIRIYSLSEQDISIIESNCRGKSNKLGFAVLLSYMRCPGIILPVDE